MNNVSAGLFNCKYCKMDIPVFVWTDNLDFLADIKKGAIDFASNSHWYDCHYNCAVCGQWIQSGQRELAIEKDFPMEINNLYNWSARSGLVRVHKKCLESFEKKVTNGKKK